MISLYIFDYDKAEKNNGLNTYIYELQKGLSVYRDIELTCVWLNAVNAKKTDTENEEQIKHLFIPGENTKGQNKTNVIDTLVIHMQNKENILLHFSWIDHLSIASLLKKKLDVTIVLTNHSIPWRDLVTFDFNEFYKLNLAFLKRTQVKIYNSKLKREQVYYDIVDHFITVTDCGKSSLMQFFNVNVDRVSVINNGIDLNTFKNRTKQRCERLRAKYGFSKDEKIVLYAGHISARKGVFDLVKAFKYLLKNKNLDNIRLVLVGPGDHSSVLKIVKKHWTKITLTGSLAKAELYDFYALADVGVVPSYIEQCSYTAIEMMHCGLPIIVSDVDGLSEMINDDCGLKIKVHYHKTKGPFLTQKALVDKMTFLLQEEQMAKQLAANARRYAIKHFEAGLMVKKTTEVYRNALKKKNGIKQLQELGKCDSISASITPTVSILITCFNDGKYLQDCLDSILNQSLLDFELIIIDDGSIDKTEEFLQKCKDLGLMYIENKENDGLSFSYNKGIDFAKGKYIACIRPSDLMMPDRLAIQTNFLENNLDFGMVGAWRLRLETEDVDLDWMVFNENNIIRLAMLFYNPIVYSTVMLRASIAKMSCFDNKYKYCEDHELWFRITEENKVKNFPQYLLNNRNCIKSLEMNNQTEKQQNTIMLMSRELDRLGINHTPQELMLHSAIGFGYSEKYFNTKDRINQLNIWLDRIFDAEALKKSYSLVTLNDFRNYILSCCGLNKKI